MAEWSGPEGASLVVYRSLRIPEGDAAMIAESLSNRLTNLPELKVVARRVETWGGRPAARVEVIAPGTGSALAPSGTGVPVGPKGSRLVPTRRVVVGIPRATQTLFLMWHAPESAADMLETQIKDVQTRLRLGRERVDSSSY
jgi:hypothetical protein